jgi:hypothetical protein
VTSYQIPLSFVPTVNVIKAGGASTGTCPGTSENPSAAAGNLCIYEEREDVELQAENNVAKGHFGFMAFAEVSAGKDYEDNGTWAVTAP